MLFRSNDTATTEIYTSVHTLSLHDALPISVEAGSAVTTGERVSAKDVLAAVPGLPVVDKIAKKLNAESEGERAAALELALEALYLAKRIDKVSGEGQTVYG